MRSYCKGKRKLGGIQGSTIVVLFLCNTREQVEVEVAIVMMARTHLGAGRWSKAAYSGTGAGAGIGVIGPTVPNQAPDEGGPHSLSWAAIYVVGR